MDSRRTRTFLNHWVVEKSGMWLIKALTLKLLVANVEALTSDHRTSVWNWKMQKIWFKGTFIVLELGCYDMILGIGWMKRHNPLSLDFEKIQIILTKWWGTSNHSKRKRWRINDAGVRKSIGKMTPKGATGKGRYNVLYSVPNSTTEGSGGGQW